MRLADLFGAAVVAGHEGAEAGDAAQVLEDGGAPAAKVEEIGVGIEQVPDAGAAVFPEDQRQPVRVFVRKGAEQHGVGDAEDRGAGADSDRDRDDDGREKDDVLCAPSGVRGAGLARFLQPAGAPGSRGILPRFATGPPKSSRARRAASSDDIPDCRYLASCRSRWKRSSSFSSASILSRRKRALKRYIRSLSTLCSFHAISST